jgi:hypothetical protein
MISSICDRTLRMVDIMEDSDGRGMEEIFLLAAASDREKTKDRTREYVGEVRKSSWSCEDMIRRVGAKKPEADRVGGGGNGGVSGIGRGFGRLHVEFLALGIRGGIFREHLIPFPSTSDGADCFVFVEVIVRVKLLFIGL